MDTSIQTSKNRELLHQMIAKMMGITEEQRVSLKTLVAHIPESQIANAMKEIIEAQQSLLALLNEGIAHEKKLIQKSTERKRKSEEKKRLDKLEEHLKNLS